MLTRIVAMVVLAVAACPAQTTPDGKTNSQAAPDSQKAAAEDISGTYGFLHEGEFVLITIEIEKEGVSGYLSRRGRSESDRFAVFVQFFSKASVSGLDVAFTTKPMHGVWFEFKGRFERGAAKHKDREPGYFVCGIGEPDYYLLRGTLTEFTVDAAKKTVSRSREAQFTQYLAID